LVDILENKSNWTKQMWFSSVRWICFSMRQRLTYKICQQFWLYYLWEWRWKRYGRVGRRSRNYLDFF